MKLYNNNNSTFKKVSVVVIVCSVMAGIYGGVIALCNRYLRDNGLLNSFSKFALILLMLVGFYLIYRWFCRRLDRLSKNQ